jgi:site-specific DNA-adenine methylase
VNKIKGLGISYMGSKRKLAPKIMDFLLERHPDCKYFYDLFGGGGAVSFDALQRPQIKTVFYNEFNTAVVNLIKKIRDDGVTPEFYEWISREKFHELKGGDDWKSGLIKTIWSFGGNQRTYLFSPINEYNKRLLHEFIVNKCESSIIEFEQHNKIQIPRHLNDFPTLHERRMSVMSYIRRVLKITDGQELQQLQHLERLRQLEQLEQLQRLQQLEQLEQLERLERLELSNLSYEKVIINTPPEQTIIYLDPPYEGTGKYQKDICHTTLSEYIKKSKFPIYMSGYKNDELVSVAQFAHRNTLANNNPAANSKPVTEHIFANDIAIDTALIIKPNTGILDW